MDLGLYLSGSLAFTISVLGSYLSFLTLPFPQQITGLSISTFYLSTLLSISTFLDFLWEQIKDGKVISLIHIRFLLCSKIKDYFLISLSLLQLTDSEILYEYTSSFFYLETWKLSIINLLITLVISSTLDF